MGSTAREGKMGLFKKKNKEITMRIYKTNQEAFVPEEPAENVLPEDEKSIPDLEPYHHGIWKRCPECAEVIYNDDLEENLKVCPRCSHHFRLTARERIEITADEGTFREFAAGVVGTDPLGFPGYAEKLEDMRGATGDNEALVTGECEIGGAKCVAAVMNGYFMMGSMGAAVGEKFALAAERALKKKLPLIAFTVSGGARMQEGVYRSCRWPRPPLCWESWTRRACFTLWC
jgi:acetyl-CoA carboxylase carboxyl transferase subunit beta